MNIIKNKIDSLYSTNINLSIIPHKKDKLTKFNIKDGIIVYNITFSDKGIICQCNNYMCTHIIYLLHKHFQLSDFSIYHLSLVRCQKSLAIHISNGNEYIENEIHKIITENECGICFTTMSQDNLYICSKCNNMVHDSCMRKWINAQKRIRRCIYCNL